VFVNTFNLSHQFVQSSLALNPATFTNESKQMWHRNRLTFGGAENAADQEEANESQEASNHFGIAWGRFYETVSD
jgi:hypothetical protein